VVQVLYYIIGYSTGELILNGKEFFSQYMRAAPIQHHEEFWQLVVIACTDNISQESQQQFGNHCVENTSSFTVYIIISLSSDTWI
jgi:hypothetical protein